MKKTTIVLVSALAAMAAGCLGEEEEANPEAQAPEDVLMHDTLPGDATPVADTTGALTVVLEEWTVRPARDTIEAANGPTVFRVRNNGTHPHVLEVEGQGQEWETDTIQPGEWVTLEADLTPGIYELYCPLDAERGSHQELGMTAPLVVVEELAGGVEPPTP